eukprot:360256-Chlamydomonas_euryale.AAC.4
MYSSAIRRCHEEGSGGGTTFQDFLKLPGHTKSLGQKSEQRRRNVPWTGRPGGTLLKTLLRWNQEAPTDWTFDTVLRSPWREWLMLCNSS